MSNVETLARSALFRGMERADVEDLWQQGRTSDFAAGELLFQRESEGPDLLILESGTANLFFPVTVLGATREVVVEQAGEGDVLAWSSVISPFTLMLGARCVAACRVRALERRRFLEYLNARPKIGYAVMHNLVGVVAHRFQAFQNMWIRDVQARLIGAAK